eukprot:16439724-Heterocapsa_arctica.AAC.1
MSIEHPTTRRKRRILPRKGQPFRKTWLNATLVETIVDVSRPNERGKLRRCLKILESAQPRSALGGVRKHWFACLQSRTRR